MWLSCYWIFLYFHSTKLKGRYLNVYLLHPDQIVCRQNQVCSVISVISEGYTWNFKILNLGQFFFFFFEIWSWSCVFCDGNVRFHSGPEFSFLLHHNWHGDTLSWVTWHKLRVLPQLQISIFDKFWYALRWFMLYSLYIYVRWGI